MRENPNRQYTSEFKEDAVRMVIAGDKSARQVARDLGIPAETLHNWLRERGHVGRAGRRPKQSQTSLNPDDELSVLRARVEQLEREKRILEEERTILKKATAFFAKEQR